MAIKADRWIKQMALENGMIEPFEDRQVREGVISYGVSSYGYDIRIADEFKIFTNVNSAIVDPKNFDPQSFVDYKGDVCIIPPNSFALGKTVEYFRIPRDVLTVCVGKCLTGDTRVVDAVTGDYLPLEEFVKRGNNRTVGLDGWKLRSASVDAHLSNGLQPVFEVHTWSGLSVKATANHPFRTYSGWTELSQLQPGDRIAVARSIPIFGSEDFPDHEATMLGLMLSDGQCDTPGRSPRFTTNDPALVEAFVEAARAFGCDVSPVGKFGYNIVNRRGRGGIVTENRATTWLRSLGCNKLSAEKAVPHEIFRARKESVRRFLRALFSGDGSVYQSGKGCFLEYSTISSRLAEDVRHLLLRFGIFSLIRSKPVWTGYNAYRIQITDRSMIYRFAKEIGFIPGSVKQRTLDTVVADIEVIPPKKSNFDTLPPAAWHTMRDAVYASGHSLREIGIFATQPDQSLPFSIARVAATASGDAEFTALVNGDIVWDTIKAIIPAGIEPVYDISVPETRNFVANDVIVHNSTYARCFRGDTRIALVDGTAPTIEELATRSETGELYFGYSIDQNGRMIVSLLETPRYIGRDALIEVVIDNGESVFCTPDHQWMLRDGRMVEAHMLRPGDSLMPLYRQLFRGYEMAYQPLNGHLYPTHRMADEWNLRHEIYKDVPGTHRHHIDIDRRNNNPWNIMRMEAGEHIRLHNAESYGEDFDPAEHSASIRSALGERAQDPEWSAHYSRVQSERAIRFWSDEAYADTRERLIELRRNPSDETRQAFRQAQLRRYSDPAERQRAAEQSRRNWACDDGSRRLMQAEIARAINLRAEITAETVRAALDQTGSIRGAARLLDCDRTVFRRFPDVLNAFRGTRPQRNHKVAAVRDLPGDHDVFCLTVPEAGNFALEAGVFVHNCGLIVNVTPFEPEWEGYVTLEISNTTPLPAKIYANEGIAQVLFFQSDEPCEVSYADKKGKYQRQQGLVLPKI